MKLKLRQIGGGGALAALLLVQLAQAQITTTYVADLVCTRDEVYSSLSSEGREFCESVLGDSCESVSKPGSYSSLADEEISSYVSLTPIFVVEPSRQGRLIMMIYSASVSLRSILRQLRRFRPRPTARATCFLPRLDLRPV